MRKYVVHGKNIEYLAAVEIEAENAEEAEEKANEMWENGGIPSYHNEVTYNVVLMRDQS